MLAGTLAIAGLELVNCPIKSPAGAGPVNVIVAMTTAPPPACGGLNETELVNAILTVSESDLVTLLYVADTEPLVCDTTGVVTTSKRTVEAPAGTATLVGTLAAALVLASTTLIPSAGAGPLKVKVAVEEAPPVTIEGPKTRLVGVGALTVRFAVRVTPFRETEMPAT